MAPKILLISVTTFFIAIFITTMGLTSIALEEGLNNVISFVGNSTESNAETHRTIEEKILASTVQIVVQSWIVDSNEAGFIIDESRGHATVMNDSKLVTHNHFNLPLSIRQQDAGTEAYGTVELLDPKGEKLFQAPLSAFELAWEDQETLVFAYENEDQFEALGLKAAEFEAWTALPLQAGMEVAQIDWDGSTTRVDWTTVQEVKLGDGIPRLVLDDGAMPGASGGGIFWQGKHIANNWKLEMMIEGSGDVVDSVTTVALNSAQVTGFQGGILE